jgi:hypothetical protein
VEWSSVSNGVPTIVCWVRAFCWFHSCVSTLFHNSRFPGLSPLLLDFHHQKWTSIFTQQVASPLRNLATGIQQWIQPWTCMKSPKLKHCSWLISKASTNWRNTSCHQGRAAGPVKNLCRETPTVPKCPRLNRSERRRPAGWRPNTWKNQHPSVLWTRHGIWAGWPWNLWPLVVHPPTVVIIRLWRRVKFKGKLFELY